MRNPSPSPTYGGLQLPLRPRTTTLSPPLSRSAVSNVTGTRSSTATSLATSLKSLPLPTLQEDDRSPYVPKSLSAPPKPSMSLRPCTAPSSLASDLRGHTRVRSSPSRSPTSTGESALPTASLSVSLTKKLVPFLLLPLNLKWWFPKRAPGPATATAKTSNPKSPRVRSQTGSAVTSNVVPPRSSTILPISTPIRVRVPVSDEVLGFLTGAANDPESLLRPARDGTVSAGDLEGFLSRVIAGSADLSKDERFKADFLTIYRLFTTSERVFEVLKRRFEATSLDPYAAGSRYS